MNAVTMAQRVVITERHHPQAYEEGYVIRATPDSMTRVRVHLDGMPGESWVAVELQYLGAVPAAGERYEWADRNNASRVPFTIGHRFPKGHQYAGLFRVLSDDATPAEREQGYSSIASAAELARFADRTHTPAVRFPPGSPEYVAYQIALTEELAKFARGESPYALQRVRESLGQPAPSPDDAAPTLDTLREAVVTTALAWEGAPELDHAALSDHVDAIRAYRKAL